MREHGCRGTGSRTVLNRLSDTVDSLFGIRVLERGYGCSKVDIRDTRLEAAIDTCSVNLLFDVTDSASSCARLV